MKRELRRKRLMDNKAYQMMNGLTRYMDRYYLDALIGIIPGAPDLQYCKPGSLGLYLEWQTVML